MPPPRGPKYHKVYHRIWTDPKVRQWTEDERMAALYLRTCPHRNTEGLFRLPVVFAMYELTWDEERTRVALSGLVGRGVIDWDPEADLVWLIDALETDPPVGSKQVQGAVNRLSETPPSFLRGRYLEQAERLCLDLAAGLMVQLQWTAPEPELSTDTLSEGESDSPSMGCFQSGNTPSIPQAHSQAHSLAQAQARPPATAPVDNSTAPEARVVEVADGLVEILGFIDQPAGTDIRLYTEHALARGWTQAQLQGCAAEAAESGADDVRRYLVGMLRKRANADPPVGDTAGSGEAGAGESWEQAWSAIAALHRQATPGLWAGFNPDWGVTERAWRAGREIRMTLRDRSESDARWAFRGAYQEQAVTT